MMTSLIMFSQGRYIHEFIPRIGYNREPMQLCARNPVINLTTSRVSLLFDLSR